MGVKQFFTWYQSKITTYDKQLWDTTIENRLPYGLKHVQMKNTKLNTDFIDYDLVRGSSFTKSKPKQGFMTVAKQATLRCIFLPIYWKWWLQQTSPSLFVLLNCVYLSQLVNIVIYLHCSSWTSDLAVVVENEKNSENIVGMEIIVPFLMNWIVSLVHSQIAATMPPSSDSPSKKRTKLTKSKSYHRRKIIGGAGVRKNERFSNHLFDTYRPNNSNSTNKKSPSPVFFTGDVNSNDKSGSNSPGPRAKDHSDDEEDEEVVLRRRRLSSKKTQAEDDGFESYDDWVKNQAENKAKRVSSESRLSTEAESDGDQKWELKKKRSKHRVPTINITSIDSTCDTDDDLFDHDKESPSCKASRGVENGSTPPCNHEWFNLTTNSEDCSYSSDLDEVSDPGANHDDYLHDWTPTVILNTSSIKVSCIIWKRDDIKKAELSMLDISSTIIGKVESTPQSMDYFYIGIIVSTLHALIPMLYRLSSFSLESGSFVDRQYSIFELLTSVVEILPNSSTSFVEAAFGSTLWERWIISTACLQRWFLASIFFFLLAVAENTFKQRFLYAKLFSHLTSFRRAQQSSLPHFRLNKVRNIKTWLSVRSYLKQRGPQRSVDVIVSTAFIIALLLLSFLCMELLRETGALKTQYHVEALIWCIGVGVLLLRFMTLGNNINKKYRNLSVLITEQINLHLQIEQKPQKKEELTLANNVLKLAIDLIKELQSPFKISGLCANSFLYNATKLVILSALSGVLSELLGFKLKLHKIKMK